ncbi:thrombomodulin [Clinocottus analis]|uniref:thrombomodulin n=1 Tax=Clinocottus analis TaxID=304258 RepID=UPI0035C0663A
MFSQTNTPAHCRRARGHKREQRGPTMRDVTGLFVFLLTFLVQTGGIEPSSGYCAGTQCFTVFHHGSGFVAAQDRCRERGGHLMTVRSSVSHDILSILLGNLTGRYWIGLRLETGCPHPAADLRGFQWVTGDREGDFSHWPPDLEGSCSSARCVSVSQEDKFQWTPEPCDGHLSGFLCEYSFREPCQGLPVAPGESVTYRTPMGFAGEGVLSLPPGSTAVRMPAETKYVCFKQQWLQAPWSCEIHEGGCEHKCAVNPKHEPSCFCPLGQTVNPSNKVTCELADGDDPCADLRCAHTCYRDGDSHVCLCDHGFKLAQDGRSCVDLNDCGDARQCPGENFKCVNSIGGFQCVCADGYAAVRGGLCADVDECASAPCEHDCANAPGSYQCSCYDGYKEDPEAPEKCVRHCGKEQCVAECDPNNNFQCYCPEGYVASGETQVVCIDMDECSFSYCDQGCKNTFGSYVCSCSPGYTLVEEFRCVQTEEESGGSGEPETPSDPTTPAAPSPTPPRRPSGVSAWGLAGIIVCTALVTFLLVFLADRVLNSRGKTKSGGARKEDDAHGLERVTRDPLNPETVISDPPLITARSWE